MNDDEMYDLRRRLAAQLLQGEQQRAAMEIHRRAEAAREADEEAAEVAVAAVRQQAPALSLGELGFPPALQRDIVFPNGRREVSNRVETAPYAAKLDRYCEAVEDAFEAGSNEAHLAWWQVARSRSMQDFVAQGLEAPPSLADMLPTCIAVLPTSVFSLQRLLLLREASHGVAAAVHEALGHVTRIHLSDLNAANARTLCARCTGLRHVDLDLTRQVNEHLRGVHILSRPEPTAAHRQLLIQSTKDAWIRSGGADAVLCACAAVANGTLTHLHARDITWKWQDGPHDAPPSGFFDESWGVWSVYEDDVYDGEEGGDRDGRPLVKRGLTDAGLSCLHGLHELHVEGCQCLTDDGIAGICARSPSLCSLDVSICSALSDRVLIAVSQHCPELTTLFLERCIPAPDDPASYGPTVTLVGLRALVDGVCTKLRTLSLVGQRALLGHRNGGPKGDVAECIRTLKARGVCVRTRTELPDSYW